MPMILALSTWRYLSLRHSVLDIYFDKLKVCAVPSLKTCSPCAFETIRPWRSNVAPPSNPFSISMFTVLPSKSLSVFEGVFGVKSMGNSIVF